MKKELKFDELEQEISWSLLEDDIDDIVEDVFEDCGIDCKGRKIVMGRDGKKYEIDCDGEKYEIDDEDDEDDEEDYEIDDSVDYVALGFENPSLPQVVTSICDFDDLDSYIVEDLDEDEDEDEDADEFESLFSDDEENIFDSMNPWFNRDIETPDDIVQEEKDYINTYRLFNDCKVLTNPQALGIKTYMEDMASCSRAFRIRFGKSIYQHWCEEKIERQELKPNYGVLSQNGRCYFYDDVEGKKMTLTECDITYNDAYGEFVQWFDSNASGECFKLESFVEYEEIVLKKYGEHETVGYMYRDEKFGPWGFVNADLTQVIPHIFDDYRVTSDGLLLAEDIVYTEDFFNAKYMGNPIAEKIIYIYDFKRGGMARLLKHKFSSASNLKSLVCEVKSPYRSMSCVEDPDDDNEYKSATTIFHQTKGKGFGELIEEYIFRYRVEIDDELVLVSLKGDSLQHFGFVDNAKNLRCLREILQIVAKGEIIQNLSHKDVTLSEYLGQYDWYNYFTICDKFGKYALYAKYAYSAHEKNSETGDSQEVLPMEYEYIGKLYDDLDDEDILKLNVDYDKKYLMIKKDGFCGIYDIKYHRFVLPMAFDAIYKLEGEFFNLDKYVFVVEKDGFKGIYDINIQEYILPIAYTEIEISANAFIVERFGKKGLCTKAGEQVVPCEYAEIFVDYETCIDRVEYLFQEFEYEISDDDPVHLGKKRIYIAK